MNGGWPSDQQISFSPLLNQDGVKVAGWLDDWRADMLGGKKHEGCKKKKPHADYPELELKAAKTTVHSVKAHLHCRLAGHASFVEKAPVPVDGQALLLRDLGDYISNYVHDGAPGLQFQVHEHNIMDIFFFSPT